MESMRFCHLSTTFHENSRKSNDSWIVMDDWHETESIKTLSTFFYVNFTES